MASAMMAMGNPEYRDELDERPHYLVPITRNKNIMRRTRRYSFVSHPSIKYRSRFYMWELKLKEL